MPINSNQKPIKPLIQDERSIIIDVTDSFISAHMQNTTLADLLNSDVASSYASLLMQDLRDAFAIYNSVIPRGEPKLICPRFLPAHAVVKILAATHDIKVLVMGDSKSLVTRQYYSDGKPQGVWRIVDDHDQQNTEIKTAIYNLVGLQLKKSDVPNITAALWAFLESYDNSSIYVTSSNYPNYLIPCRNGIYNMMDHTFSDWGSPVCESRYGDICFTHVLDTRYVPHAPCPSNFDPFRFICSLFDTNTPIGQASAHIVKDSIQFAFRNWSGGEGYTLYGNNVADRAAGHNGKTTLLEMIEFVIQHTALPQWKGNAIDLPFSNGPKILKAPIDKWGNEFSLGGSIRSAVMLVSDESERGKYIENTGVLKLLARRQPVLYNIKYKQPFSYAMPGVKWHLQNEVTKYGTKDLATFSHNIYLAFDQDFGTQCNPAIKEQYICQEDVAEYLLSVTLESELIDDYNPVDIAALTPNIDIIVESNMQVFQFMDEFMRDLVVPAYSSSLLYAAYHTWARKNGFCEISIVMFKQDLLSYVSKHQNEYDWIVGTPTRASTIARGNYSMQSAMLYDLLHNTIYTEVRPLAMDRVDVLSSEYIHKITCRSWLVRK